MPTTNLSEATLSLAIVIQILSPIAIAVVGGASWTVKRVIGKMESSLESLQKDLEDLNDRCVKAEERIRRDREHACEDVSKVIEVLKRECRECMNKRIDEHTGCINIYGKLGARITKLETEHALHHSGALRKIGEQ